MNANFALLYKPKGWTLGIQTEHSQGGCETASSMALVRGNKKGKNKGGNSYDIMMAMFMFTPKAFGQLVGFLEVSCHRNFQHGSHSYRELVITTPLDLGLGDVGS